MSYKLDSEQNSAVQWALDHIERHQYQEGSIYDGYAKAFKSLLANRHAADESGSDKLAPYGKIEILCKARDYLEHHTVDANGNRSTARELAEQIDNWINDPVIDENVKPVIAYMHRFPGAAWELSFADDDGKLVGSHSKAYALVAADHGECAREYTASCKNVAIVASEEAKPLGYTTTWDIQQMAVGGVGSFFPEREEAEENIPLFTYPVSKEAEPIGYTTQANLDVLAKYNAIQIYRDPEKGDIPVYLHTASKEAVTLSDEGILRELIQHASEVSDHTHESLRSGVIRLASHARALLTQRDTSVGAPTQQGKHDGN